MLRPRSLRGLILLLVTGPTVLALVASSIYDYFAAQRPATQAYDQALFSATLVLSQHMIGPAGAARLALPQAVENALRTDRIDRVSLGVYTLDGRHVGGDAGLPLPAPDSALARQAFDAEYQGQPVRVAAARLNSDAGEHWFVVAETLGKRRGMARELVANALVSTLATIGGIALAVLLATAYGLSPLARLRRQLMERSHRDLRPLEVADAPAELAPIVNEINSLLHRLDEAAAAQNRFIANAAHQLRTPLAGLKTQIELAREQSLTPEARQLLDQAHGATERLARLISQLLSLARTEADSAASDLGVEDLAAVIGGGVQEWVPQALARDVDLGFELQPAMVSGNATLLREMASNLIDNAVRYAGPSSRVTVRCGLRDGRPYLEVEDNGPGIPRAERGRVMERFYRVPGSTATGSGLGLAIVAEIAALHRADVALGDAAGGHGLRATVLFQAAEARTEARAEVRTEARTEARTEVRTESRSEP